MRNSTSVKCMCFFFIALLLCINTSLLATPECPIVTERFQGLANGTTVNNSATGWTINASNIPNAAYFAVKSNRFHAQELGGVGIWTSKVFSVTGYSSFQVATKISSEGDMNSTEYVQVYYRVNGGSEILLDQRTGNFGTVDVISPVLTGTNVQLIVKMYNYNNGGSQTSKYYIEEYRVFKDKGPCASGIPVSATTDRNTLTCTNPSATLTASSTGTSVTYLWAGPNNFSSTAVSPVVSTAGTYTVTGTNSSGSGSASVTITDDKLGPIVTTNGAVLGCASTVTIGATSSVPSSQYNWTGPGGFSSTQQNPSVSLPGTYTVIVTNPANGCSTSQTALVSSSSGASAFWLEDFTWTNGTTVDNGTTAWSIQNPGSGTFSVQSNEFMASFTSANEGVWLSGVIDISTKSSVIISTTLRSGTASSNDFLETDDYIQVYYKLNNGPETLIYGDVAGLNGVDNGTSSYAVTSSAISGSTLQIVIRARNSSSTERYYFDDVKLTGSSSSAFSVAAAVSGAISCSSPSVTLSSSASISGATYSWTGPGGFTSTLQNPIVTVPGQYTVTATSSGCTATASVTVTGDSTGPNLTATGGALSCTSSSLTLTASSTVSGAQYAWTGPNNFSSTLQNPVVTVAGAYTVTVTNPANGCKTSQTVQVTTTGISTLWLEDFTFANGTTTDTGTTSWSTVNTSTGTFAVTGNEFKVTNMGSTTGVEGVLTTGSINISGKVNVSIEISTRSVGSTMNNSGSGLDYLRLYYKLNGGSEVLFSEQLGSINNSSSSYTIATIGSLSGTTLQIIVRAKTTAADEYYYFDNIKVSGSSISSSVNVSASSSGSITCTTSSVSLSASSTTPSVSYSWTGPDGFTSVQQNPGISKAGVYTVTASTGGGCAATASVTVTENKTAPSLTASGGTLTCTSSLSLSASSTVSNAQFTWSGPGGFSSTLSNPVVTVPGTYTVLVRNPANGCTATQSVQVLASSSSGTSSTIWLEDFTFANGTTVDNGTTPWSIQNPGSGTFSVQSNEFKASFNSANEGVWLSGIIDISAKSDVVISTTLRSGTASSGDFLETDDYIQVYYKLNNGAETLIYGDVAGLNGIDNGTSSLAVTSGAINGNTLQIIIRARNSGSTERYYFDDVKLVGKDSPIGVITTSTSGALSCTNTSVQLSASVTATGATYYWIRPDGTTINQQNPLVTVPGDYTVVVTVNGCQGTKVVTVLGNVETPDVTIIGADLTCSTPSSVVLAAYSTKPNLTYSWTGPGGFTSTLINPSVSSPGTYTVIATNPSNNCSNSASFTVGFSDGSSIPVWNETFDELSDGSILDNGSTAWSVDNSKIHTVDLSAYSGESGTPYYFEVRGGKLTGKTTRGEVVWTSQVIDISSFGQVQAKIDMTGEGSLNDQTDCGSNCFDYDYIKIFYKINGGIEIPFTNFGDIPGKVVLNPQTASTGIVVGNSIQIIIRAYNTGNNEFYYFDNIRVLKIQQGSGIGGVTAVASGSLTCANNSVTLSASPVLPGVSYLWSGPGAIADPTLPSVTVSVAGTYTLSVTGGTGCSGSTTVIVTDDRTVPVNVTAQVSGSLTCSNSSVTLTGGTNTSGVTYLWSGPGTINNPTSAIVSVSTPGIYTFTVTNTSNGCFASASVMVNEDQNIPASVTATASGVLTCSTSTATLTGTTTSTGVTYLWTGPGTITNSTSSVATVSTAGTYTLKVTSNATGCFTTATVVVTQDVSVPAGITATASGSLTCLTTSVTLTGSTTSTGITYLWTGPGTITNSTSAVATVSTAGTYTLKVTNTATGCFATATVVATQDVSVPVNVTATASGSLTCSATSVTLTGSTTSTGVTYLWTGPGTITNSTSSIATVSTPGTYTLKVTNTATGCFATATVIVTQDISAPLNVTATASGALTCSISSVTLTGSTTTTGVTYLWTGPGTITNSTSAVATVSTAGTYTLKVTKTSTGCFATATVLVTQDQNIPANVTATASGVLTCSATSITLTGSTTSTGVTYLWTGPGTITNSTSAVATVSIAGTYTLKVTSTATGCFATATVLVTQDVSVPVNVTAIASGSLTCSTTSITLTGSTTSTGVTYFWTGPGTITNSTSAVATVSTAGTYTLKVTSTATGCFATATVVVTQDVSVPVNVTAIASGSLTCSATSVTLTGSTTSTGVTYLWTGPGAITNSTSAVATVSTPGTYTLKVTNTATGCFATATVVVTQDVSVPVNVTAIVSGTLTCSTTSVTLTGSTTSTGVTYLWTGPGAITNSTSTVATVSTPGTYTLKVTNTATGCFTTATVIVTQDISAPLNITATASGALTCSITSITLTGSTATTGVTYLWTGPGAITNPTSAIATVSTAGTYTLKVTKTSTGCFATATVVVTQDASVPANVTATASGTLTCSIASITITGSTTSTGVTYVWTGPGTITNSTSAVATVSTPGTYTLKVTSTATGCFTTATVIVTQDISAPLSVTATASGALTCSIANVTLTGSTATTGVTYLWTGPGTITNPTSAVATVSTAGTYTLKVTKTSTGCFTTATISVTQDLSAPTGVTATGGTLTCITTNVTLTGATTSTGVTSLWTGPGAITNPTSLVASASSPGTYTLTVTKTSTGCSTVATTTVNQNITPPGASANVGGVLTCTATSVTLAGSSPASGVTFSWTGPGTFTSSQQNPATSTPGVYTVNVFNPVNGCSSTASVSVSQNISLPTVTAGVSGTLTCTTTTVTLNASSTTTGATFGWTGPAGYTSSLQNPVASIAGPYTVTVTNPSTGCQASASVTVVANVDAPTVAASVSGVLSCLIPSVTLTGSSSVPGVQFRWVGPLGFATPTQNAITSIPGEYTLLIRNPVNGCAASTSVTVDQSITVPAGVTAVVSGVLTCGATSVTLTGNSTTPNVTYSWTGPNGFASTQQSPVTSVPGIYTVTFTHPVSGCTASASVTVTQNNGGPAGVAATTSGSLTCTTLSVTISASPSTGVSYSWIGPGGFTSSLQNATINVPGTYTVTVSLPSNGCSATASVTVIQNTALPANVNATVSGVITCAVPNVTITGSSTTSGVTYSWTGPSFTSTAASASVSTPGTYTLVVTNPDNGCQATGSIAVTQDKVSPNINISNTTGSTALTCYVSPLLFTGTSTTAGATFQWTGPGGFISNGAVASVTVPGAYILTVTSPNGCTATRTRNITQNLVPPTVTASASGQITCLSPTATLTGTSSATPVTYSWTGPGGFTSTLQNPVVTAGGVYVLTVITPAGCTGTASVTVQENKILPANVVADVSGSLNCTDLFVTLSGSSSTSGVTYVWAGPSGFSSTQQNVQTSIAGNYTLTVTNMANGCVTVVPATVIDLGCD